MSLKFLDVCCWLWVGFVRFNLIAWRMKICSRLLASSIEVHNVHCCRFLYIRTFITTATTTTKKTFVLASQNTFLFQICYNFICYAHTVNPSKSYQKRDLQQKKVILLWKEWGNWVKCFWICLSQKKKKNLSRVYIFIRRIYVNPIK